jgi:membrane peptidoglycan carboxypeptidase
VSSNDDKYPEPEGWENDGFWRDPSIDSDYETGLNSPIRPVADGPREDPGYSYWADGKGWENSPGSGGAGGTGGGTGPRPGDATSLDAGRGAYQPGGQQGGGQYGGGQYGGAGGSWPPAGDQTGFYGAGGGPTAVYPGGPAGPGGPGRGPGGPGGRGPGGPGRPGGRRGKRKGDWWRRWTWKKALAVVGSAFVLFILCLAGGYYYLVSSATIPAALSDALEQSSTVYYSNGTTVLGTITSEDRQNLTLSQIPKTMQDAVIAAEDRGFWTEGGISPTGILRAAYDDLMTSGGNKSGGSTITQEFVRNYYQGVGTQQTVSRKIKEIFIAQKLASSKSKDWILQNYLNLIYLGDGSYGVEAASETYFGKPVSKLTVAQDAVIAAVIQQPSTYYLPQYRTSLTARWHYVLDGMVSIGDLTQAQADSVAFPKLLTDSPSYHPPGLSQGCAARSTAPWAPYLMLQVCDELTDPSGDNLSKVGLEDSGMKIVTTVSESMEAEMYKAVNSNMAQLTAEGSQFAKLPSWAMIGAELQNPSNGQILAMYPGIGQNMSANRCLAYKCDENTTLTREEVGSSFKPYVLSTAVQEGMNVQDSIMNSSEYLCIAPDSSPDAVPLTYSQAIPAAVYDMPGHTSGCANPDAYKVENDDGAIIGTPAGPKGDNLWKTNVQNAMAQSSNTAFTDLAHRAGTAAIVNIASQYGVDTEDYSQGGSNLKAFIGEVSDVALGVSTLTVNEQTQMLATIDDDGVYHAGHIIKYWQMPAGPEQTPNVESHVVLTPSQDSQVQYAMEATTVDGTAIDAALGLGNRPIIGKTGTTSDEQSGFFIGAIPQYAMVVGMFTSDPGVYTTPTSGIPVNSLSELGGGGFGGFWPAKIWNTFALAEFANLPMENFQNPDFTGNLWNMLGTIPKAKPKKKKPPTNKCNPHKIHGRPFPAMNPGCVTPTPTPTPTPSLTPTGLPTGIPTGLPTGLPSTSPTPTPTATGSVTPTATPTPSASSTRTGPPFGGNSAITTQGGVKAGLAVGGVLVTVLPGSLLWTTATRRRRKRRGEARSVPGTEPDAPGTGAER